MKTRTERFQEDFERVYGEGKWALFCEQIYARTRPMVIQTTFASPAGSKMNKPSYYKWEARAWEVKE